MTLDSRVYIHDDLALSDLVAKCEQLIGAPRDVRFTDSQDRSWKDGKSFVEPHSPWTFSNDPGQGLCAWLLIYHRIEAPLRPTSAEHEPDICDEDCDGAWHDPACWLIVSLDTAYSYRGPDGGCGDLHARIIAELGQWLDERGIAWSWRNEFTGDLHQGYDGLTDLASQGAPASAWFRDIVRPAILAKAATL
jgi:hypothetical protein